MKIAVLTLTSSPGQGIIEARAVTVMPGALFPSLNNIYRSEFNTDFLPKRYLRNIRQSTVVEDLSVEYYHSNSVAKATNTGSNENKTYAIDADTRDFFSLLVLIMSGNANQGDYSLDGNGKLWTANLRNEGIHMLRTKLGKYSCQRYMISFTAATDDKMPYVDMVTHNLLKQGNKLTLWLSEERIPMQAVVRRGAISLSCEITEYLP